jgi:hypothetical protein
MLCMGPYIWGHIVDELVELKKKAEECRLMAKATPNFDSRHQLLKAAEAWENLLELRKQGETHH